MFKIPWYKKIQYFFFPAKLRVKKEMYDEIQEIKRLEKVRKEALKCLAMK